MAITVICPGCMTRFQVDDRFAGKKGPCPKCGHIIEIPKENLVIHAPEDITSAVPGKPGTRRGENVRPILQSRFIFTKLQIFLGLIGIAIVIGIAFYLAPWPSGNAKNIIGLAGTFLLGIPLVAFGYMMVRENDDLEIFLGNELYKRAFLTACCFGVTWLLLEWLVSYLDPGTMVIIYIVPLAILATLGAMVVFDTEFGKALLIYCIFAACMIGLRGIMFAPHGWIWEPAPVQVRAAVQTDTPAPNPMDKNESVASDQKTNQIKNQVKDSTTTIPDKKSSPDTKATPPNVNPGKKVLNREAPDPKKGLRR